MDNIIIDGTDDGRTVYRAYIPIARRSAVTDTPPTPEEQSAITQAIALMQEYLERMPTKTSDLANDGDGTDEHSPFATQAWVAAQAKFLLTIETDGTLKCARYSTGASAVAVPNNAWLNLNVTYVSAT